MASGPCHALRLRCSICGNPDWTLRGVDEECTHCRLHVAEVEGLARAWVEIVARLASGAAEECRGDRWALDQLGWRHAAWRYGFVLDGNAARPARRTSHSIALAIMTCPREAGPALALLRSLAPHFARSVVLVDGDPALFREALPGAEIASHSIDGDFAAQRNRLQAMAGDGWVLQLDSDEGLDPSLLASLGWLTAAADRDGLRSLGLPRRNMVDGVASACWPDIQYRLNRADVRFRNRVHERPVMRFEDSSLALPGAIEHRLSAERVRARTRIYEAMSAGAGRPQDEERLLRRFDPIADR